MVTPQGYVYYYDSLREIKIKCQSFEAYMAVCKYLRKRKKLKAV